MGMMNAPHHCIRSPVALSIFSLGAMCEVAQVTCTRGVQVEWHDLSDSENAFRTISRIHMYRSKSRETKALVTSKCESDLCNMHDCQDSTDTTDNETCKRARVGGRSRW